MEAIEEDGLMATISSLDKEKSLALLAVMQAAPDNDTIADVWAIYDILSLWVAVALIGPTSYICYECSKNLGL